MTAANNNSNKRWSFLKKWPVYVLLLPVFFVLHGVRENFGFIFPSDYLPLLLFYLAAAVILFGLLYLCYRNRNKTGLICFLILCTFFFYGFIQDTLKQYLPAVNRYSILLPLFFLLLFISAILIKKSKNDFKTACLFLNSILLIYIIFDLAAVITKTISPQADKFSVYSFSTKQYNRCDSCEKPDVYFLVFDEYASSVNLQHHFSFSNHAFDSFLLSKQFHIQTNSISNYNFTPFSIASILNMSYINGITPHRISIDDYAACNKLIRENETVKYFAAAGYDIINCSIFDIAGNPSPVNQDFLPLKAKLITDRTLWGRIKKDILWNVFTGKFEVKWLTENSEYQYRYNNEKLLKMVKDESSRKNKAPRFIYAHYNMPHPPYYFDKDGKEIPKEKLTHQYDSDKQLYLGYVQYSNKKIEELVNTILQNSNGRAAIIIMGDHGFRNDSSLPQPVFFQNQNAIYLPEKNYLSFYNNISGVNQFRVLINSLFDQGLPLLKDSTIFLTDSK